MAVQFTDNYNRTNNASLGANWNGTGISNASIVSNQLSTAIQTDTFMLWQTPTSTDDQVVSIDWVTRASNGEVVIVLRSTSPTSDYSTGTWYRLMIDSSGNCQIHRYDNGSATQLRAYGAADNGITVVEGTMVSATAIGSTFTLYVNGVVAATGTDATVTGRYGGVLITCGGTFDNFVLRDASYASHTIALVTSGGAASSNNTTATTSSLDTRMANLLVACGQMDTGGSPTISDSKGNTWYSAAISAASNGAVTRIWYAKNALVGTGHTFTLTAGGPTLEVFAFSGADREPLSQFASFGTGGSSYTDIKMGYGASIGTYGIVVPTVGEVVVTACMGGSSTTTLDGGFTTTNAYTGVGGQHWPGAAGYLIESAKNTLADPLFDDPGGAFYYSIAAVSFKAARQTTYNATGYPDGFIPSWSNFSSSAVTRIGKLQSSGIDRFIGMEFADPTTARRSWHVKALSDTPLTRENYFLSGTFLLETSGDEAGFLFNSNSAYTSFNIFKVHSNGAGIAVESDAGIIVNGLITGTTVTIGTPFTLEVIGNTSGTAIVSVNGVYQSTVSSSVRTGLYAGVFINNTASISSFNFGSPNFVQSIEGHPAVNTAATASFSTLPVLGNKIFVAAGASASFSTAAITVTDNQGHIYTLLTGTAGNGTTAWIGGIWYTTVTTSSGTFTITVANSGATTNVQAFGAAEFTGIGALDKTTTPVNGVINGRATGNLSANGAVGSLELVALFESESTDATTITVDAVSPPYASIGNDPVSTAGSAPDVRWDFSFRILTAATNVGATWTISGGATATTLTANGATFLITTTTTSYGGTRQKRFLYVPGTIASRNRRGW